MGNLMKKMVAMLVAVTMVLTSGLFVFASDSPSGGKTPAKPTSPTQAKLNTTVGTYSKKTMKVTWSKVKGASYYVIYVNGKVKVKKATGTSYTLKGMKANGKYTISVQAVNAAGKGKKSVIKSKTLSKRWFQKITFKKAKKGKKKGTAVLTWKKVKGATGYQILYKSGNGAWKTKFIGKKTKYTLKGLKKGTCKFRIRAVKSGYLGLISGTKTCKVK